MDRKVKSVAAGLILLLGGCTDAQVSKLTAHGSSHKITLYSGGQAVRTWRSTGAVMNEGQSDGFYFKDKETGKLIRVSGDVVIEVE